MSVRPLLAALLALAAGPALAQGGAAFDADQGAVDRHARSVARLVLAQFDPPPAGSDRGRLALLKGLLAEHAPHRRDLAGREPILLSRRAAIVAALDRNLSLAAARSDPERARTFGREAGAVFDPVFDLSLGYARKDTYRRTRVGMVTPRIFVAAGNDPFVFNRVNICTATFNAACTETAPTLVYAYQYYLNLESDPLAEEVTANPGRTYGHPVQQITYTLGLSQQLPWGGSLTLTDQTVQQKIYYREGHYWEDGQFSAQLTGALSTSVPGGKGFGRDNPANTAVATAAAQAESADWQLKEAVNLTLRDTDTAFFEVVRAVETVAATATARDLVRTLTDRMRRLFDNGLATRYQRALFDAELVKADARIETALQGWVDTSLALAELTGETAALRGAVLFVPFDVADDLKARRPTEGAKALDLAKANRPDLFVADLDQRIARLQLALARNQAKPDIQLSANITTAQNGTVYGQADYLAAQRALVGTGRESRPDSLSQTYTGTYTYPLFNRAARAAVGAAELGVADAGLAREDTGQRVAREVRDALAYIQSARARHDAKAREERALSAAYDSAVRRLDAGLVAEDEVVSLLRRLTDARLAVTGAAIDNLEAETALLYAQGTIARDLPGALAETRAERNRLALLAEAGQLTLFGAARPAARR